MFGAHALADVMQERVKGRRVALTGRGNRDLDRELVTVAMDRRELQALAEYRPHARRKEPLKARKVLVAQVLRNDRVAQHPARSPPRVTSQTPPPRPGSDR